MDDDASSKWFSGIVLAAAGIVWGISSLASGQLVIPFLRWHGIPLSSDIPLRGSPAMLFSIALIWFGLYLHFSDFWSCYPNAERVTKIAEPLTGWAAAICFIVGIIAWIFK